MDLAASYQSVNKRLQSQYREPAWGWGLRVAMSVTIPLLWGAFFEKESGAEWMAIAAESVSFIELKGNIGQRVRLLLSASLLSVLFCVVGSLAGNLIWISLPGMFAVGFLSGLFKNLGDRGMGLALSVYIFYIITSAYPVPTSEALWTRCGWVSLGALWTTVVGLCSFLFIRIGTPYRRTIAVIWKSVAALAQATGKGWDGTTTRSSVRDVYLKEKDVRTAIDSSLFLFEETADQVSKSQKTKYALAQSRRCASLVSMHIIQISEAAEQLYRQTGDRQLMVQFHSLFRALEQIGERMEIYLLTLKEEERILVTSRVERLRKLSLQISELPEATQPGISDTMKKILVLTERVAKLVEKSLELLAQPGERRVYRAYSFTQTLNILHPRYVKNNLRQLFNLDSITTRYAIRIGIAAFLGTLIGYLLGEGSAFALFLHNTLDLPLVQLRHHGYWIAFTAIIVSQPYFGATLKKGIERSAGTVAGIIVGSGFLLLPFPLLSRFILVFFSSVFLIYFLRRQYSVAAFFITLMLVGLLAIDPGFDAGLMKTRILCTLIGSALAIGAGFLLLPSWDKDHLPRYLAQAFTANFSYFQGTFYRSEERTPWTRLKRIAESRSSNAFDSFTRFMQEPGMRRKKGYANYYYLLTHNVRITRELNNFHGETELETEKIPVREKEKFYQMLNQCDDLFRDNIQLLRQSGNDFVEDKYLKTFPEEGFNTMNPVESQMVYIEKMLIELKAIYNGLHGAPSEPEPKAIEEV
ncbi:FUSC family protein [Taibaiella koreensis]|uniref:FUSC family protein n=1 Tax=Taibaiella koreensis TaxID=1268548 RepID=UPI000E59EA70|nr:FUSC family protein [Taibaiella koreensis]